MYFTENISSKKKIPVSLITTLYNEEKTLYEFLDSLLKLTVLPLEIIIVDGGSKDKTVEILEEFKKAYFNELNVRIIVDPTCTIYFTPAPIAKGRNIAIKNASYEILAVTDAGCKIHYRWLEEITKPLFQDSSVQFVAGWYEPLAQTYFEECQAMATFRSLNTINSKKFLPSSRSVAFTKSIWNAVGGYPEKSYTAEDTLFDLKIRQSTPRIAFAPQAIVYWRLRPNLNVFIKLVYRYGFGDGFSNLLIENFLKNTLKLFIAITLFVFGFQFNKLFFVVLIFYIWLLPFLQNIRGAFRLKSLHKYPLVALLKILSNTVYLIGYIKGFLSKKHPQFEKVIDHTA